VGEEKGKKCGIHELTKALVITLIREKLERTEEEGTRASNLTSRTTYRSDEKRRNLGSQKREKAQNRLVVSPVPLNGVRVGEGTDSMPGRPGRPLAISLHNSSGRKKIAKESMPIQ